MFVPQARKFESVENVEAEDNAQRLAIIKS
jgi:hypothetical protein